MADLLVVSCMLGIPVLRISNNTVISLTAGITLERIEVDHFRKCSGLFKAFCFYAQLLFLRQWSRVHRLIPAFIIELMFIICSYMEFFAHEC